ncbi:hypothetical protein P7K49_008810, partial [Saguinus oedipus]
RTFDCPLETRLSAWERNSRYQNTEGRFAALTFRPNASPITRARAKRLSEEAPKVS